MNVSDVVRQEITKLIPASLINDIACFVFYDNHPRCDKNIDITVCTKTGELREYFRRDLQSSLNLNSVINKPSELRILRNNDSDIFYLLSSKDELYIISSKESLQIHKKLTNIDRYDVNDAVCRGESCLKIVRKDDAVPELFDSNFESLESHGVDLNPSKDDNSFPIMNELKRKLIEARYSNKCNEETYAQYLSLHQKVSLLSYKSQQPAMKGSVFQDSGQNVASALKLKSHKPWVKVCNKKLIIILKVLLEGKEPIQNIHILLNSTNVSSLVYTTKIFTKLSSPPFWEETDNNVLKPGQEYAIAAVTDFEDIVMYGRIEVQGSISYEMADNECLLPFDDVVVSSVVVMGDEFDVLSGCKENENTILAILSTTEKTELHFRHIQNNGDPEDSMLDLFCTYLQMDRVENDSNILVYRKSPYHALNGIMIVFHGRNSDNIVPVSLYSRSSSQVSVLLHNIYDTIPAKIIATTPTYKITAKFDDLSQYNEEISSKTKQVNYTDYALSMLNRSTKILEHLDASMIKMNESKNPLVQSKVGSHIDLFAGGVDIFKKFKEDLLKETEKSVDSLMKLKIVDQQLEETEKGVDSLMKLKIADQQLEDDEDVMVVD